MVKTEARIPYLIEIVRLQFNLSWCTGYYPKRYSNRMDPIIQKYPENHRPHIIRKIWMFEIEENLHNKQLGRNFMKKYKETEILATEQYGSWA